MNCSFLFMQANGAQLREVAALYDAGHRRLLPVEGGARGGPGAPGPGVGRPR